jgi:DNA modification methylase
MPLLLHGDCLEEMKTLDDDSVDFIFCDLPYGQTSCKWDCKIDLEKFWIEIMRIKKLRTPIFMTTTTKFGVDLIKSAPKKCPFRYDLVWVKSAPTGFLSSRRMPLRKHEMVYVFYEKLPFYDLSSHTHKFIKERDTKQKNGKIYEGDKNKNIVEGKYDPPLPVSVVKQEGLINNYGVNRVIYKDENGNVIKEGQSGQNQTKYDPPLPVSVVKEEGCYGEKVPNSEAKYGQKCARQYDPPLPVSVVKEPVANEEYEKREKKVRNTIKKEENYGKGYLDKKVNFRKYDPTLGGKGAPSHLYDPPLPVSVVKQDVYDAKRRFKNGKLYKNPRHLQKGDDPIYDPPLPTSMLEIKSTKGKHSTEKPVALMEWLLKYFSKEGDVVLDPTMGSGSTGVACKNLNREFIGIEMDDDIFEIATSRLEL